jgi:hypothetical protein
MGISFIHLSTGQQHWTFPPAKKTRQRNATTDEENAAHAPFISTSTSPSTTPSSAPYAPPPSPSA